MDFNYVLFTEEWASLYKPMHHVPGEDSLNRRFYICDSYNNMTSFMEHMDTECTPCVIVESQQEGNVTEGKDHPVYSFYFMVRSGSTHEGYSAYDSKREAKKVMMDFVNFVRVFKYAYEDPTYFSLLKKLPIKNDTYLSALRAAVMNGDPCMMNLGVEDFLYETLNEMADTWYGVQMTLDDVQLYDMCADISMYE